MDKYNFLSGKYSKRGPVLRKELNEGFSARSGRCIILKVSNILSSVDKHVRLRGYL